MGFTTTPVSSVLTWVSPCEGETPSALQLAGALVLVGVIAVALGQPFPSRRGEGTDLPVATYYRNVGWRDQDPGLPIKLGPVSNGEYDPHPLPPVLLEAQRRAREACELNARRKGMSRREFLLSLAGAATTLAILNACTREEARQAGRTPGGGYTISPEATLDDDVAMEEIGGDEFVFDVQGHLLDYEVNPATNDAHQFWTHFPQQDCGEDDPRDCFSIAHFMDEMFLKSDTSMAVVSSLPLPPDGPLSMDVLAETARVAKALCRDERVLLHANPFPNIGPLGSNLDKMEDAVRSHPITAWKVFTHYPDLWDGSGNAWWLDDHDPSLPQVGAPFIEQALDLGVSRIAVHKGLSSGNRNASPEDIGPAARKHPEMRFLVYHSGYEDELVEGPYARSTANQGVNRLITSMKRAGVGPGENVYAELGTTWWNLMRFPDQAAHLLGKLLRYVGEDNVIWGTDCLFYGSPQDQIQAMRSFQISSEYRERYGYPKLTKEIKAKILGLNGARLYEVDPITVPCEFSRKELAELRPMLPLKNSVYGPTTLEEAAAFRVAHQGTP